MLLRTGRHSLPSKEIRKGARLLRAVVRHVDYAQQIQIVPMEQMQTIYERNGLISGTPCYVAVNPEVDSLIFYPVADRQYKVSTRWQLEYEVA